MRALRTLLPLVVLAACGGSEEPASPAASAEDGPPGAPAVEDGEDADARDRGQRRGARAPRSQKGSAAVEVLDAGTAPEGTPGVVAGAVRFEGDPPTRVPIAPVANTAGCKEHGTPPLSENVIVVNGKLENVCVAIREVPEGYAAPAPDGAAYRIDQVGCMFVPHVAALRAGREVEVANSDATSHNVRVTGTLFPGVNKTIGAGGKPITMVFDDAEVLQLSCDIHPWMRGYVFVCEHPFFAVTGADGAFRLEGVPPGEYELEAWHEAYGKVRSGRFTLGPGGEVSVTYTYAP